MAIKHIFIYVFEKFPLRKIKIFGWIILTYTMCENLETLLLVLHFGVLTKQELCFSVKPSFC